MSPRNESIPQCWFLAGVASAGSCGGAEGDTLEVSVRRREYPGTCRQAGAVHFYTGMPRLGTAQMEQGPWNRDFAWVETWLQVFFLKSLLNFHQF